MRAVVAIILFFISISSIICIAKHQATGKTVLGNSQIPFSSLTPEMVSNFRIEHTYARKGINGGTMVEGFYEEKKRLN